MRTVKVAVTVGALLAMLAGSADAQGNPRKGEAERELEITQSVINKVQRLVDESENRRAEEDQTRNLQPVPKDCEARVARLVQHGAAKAVQPYCHCTQAKVKVLLEFRHLSVEPQMVETEIQAEEAYGQWAY